MEKCLRYKFFQSKVGEYTFNEVLEEIDVDGIYTYCQINGNITDKSFDDEINVFLKNGWYELKVS